MEKNYPVQPDRYGQGIGKTRAIPGWLSSRKAHLRDDRASLHSPTSLPITFEMNSDTELIQGNVLRFEPLSSGPIEINLSQYKSWYREANKEYWSI
ncbi:hypothetical protein O181_021579 [Austropuccinia psidii MF-1]|uniref:Uncharacterized protein n=1 Tax=Austropuccinia psidii MF-1 TaxID=1389203 RepID=A0A9Q3CDA9_9BASI|nr:hypothetical protein [Austropuccinia psidii MF-1]